MKNRQNAGRASSAVVLAAAIAGAWMAPAFAQSMQQAPVSHADRAFVTAMLQQSCGQLAVAQLAETRATGARASSAAAQTIAEWTALRSRLNSIAYAQGAPVRGTLDARQQTLLDRLGRTRPAYFDDAFLKAVQRGNTAALDRMQRENSTLDPGVQRFIAYAQPVVSSDEQMTSDDILGERSM
jgi:predicted outer membrane protein